jgi:decaprenylphospho-beta-D-ribofuranose 2-oxidase
MPPEGSATEPPATVDATEAVFTGWGRTARVRATSAPLLDAEQAASVVKAAGRRGVLARGLGRSYGDAAQNAGGTVLDATASTGILAFDVATGLITVRSGTSIGHLIRAVIPFGWFVPVTPGTRWVTVGGAIAADIHGKNHHRVGSWCQHVTSLRLLTADGSVRDIGPDHDAELFWATCAGMGLTGVILDATIRLIPVQTSWLRVDTDRAPDLETVMSLMADGDQEYEYSVAWIDLVATGRHLGRSVLARGGFANPDELGPRQRRWPLEIRDKERLRVPQLPDRTLNSLSVRAFNELWYRKSPRRRRGELQTIGQFFHPLDLLRDWNRMYGPRGYLQWQCVVPKDRPEVIEAIVERISDSHLASFLAVLKLFGPEDPAYLSFPKEGWTLALDLPLRPGLGLMLDELDETIVEAGGRLYLAKDSRMRAELLPEMYPRLGEWLQQRRRVDPDGRFQSDLGRRLGLT